MGKQWKQCQTLFLGSQTHVHRVSDAIQPSHPLASPSPPAPTPSQHHHEFEQTPGDDEGQ